MGLQRWPSGITAARELIPLDHLMSEFESPYIIIGVILKWLGGRITSPPMVIGTGKETGGGKSRIRTFLKFILLIYWFIFCFFLVFCYKCFFWCFVFSHRLIASSQDFFSFPSSKISHEMSISAA